MQVSFESQLQVVTTSNEPPSRFGLVGCFCWSGGCLGQGCSFKGSPKKNRQTGLGLLMRVPVRDHGSFGLAILPYPDPRENPTSRSTLGFHNLHHISIRAPNWGFYISDPPRGLCKGGPGLRAADHPQFRLPK